MRQGRILFAKSQLTQVVGHEVQVPKAQGLAREKTVDGSWPIDVGELETSEVDAATEGRAKSKSDIGAGNHHFLLNNRECATVSYLTHQLSVLCKSD
jgi:hypothetical protein